jgi:RHS repeat-associated protein
MASTMSTLSAQQAEIVENVEKTQYENTSYLVVGSLVLKPGFNFNSASQGSFYARAYDNDPTVAPSENRGFARTEQVYIEGILTDDQVIPLGVDSKSISFSYFDGIGRHTQSVQVQGSPGGSDLVQPVTYDVKQRPSISYLPYSSQGNTGTFRTGAIAEQGSFYTAPPPGITSDTKAYSNATYEDSPLDRVTEISNTGNDFQQVYATSRAKVNISGDAVRRWDIGSGRPNSTSPYPANSLSVAETTDPSGHITRTFSDFAGRTILSRTQSGTSSWFDTYYVYNDYSELLFVIPPQSSTTLAPSQAHVDLWHFQYEYDEFGRTTGTKAPGTDWLYTIYDRWDRPVLTQDGVQRAKSPAEWSYIKYDIHNRPVIIGTIANGTAIATLRTQVAASTALRFESRNTTSPLAYSIGSSYPTNANEAGILSITYYDDYGFRTNTGWASGTGNSNGLYAFSAEAGYFTLQDQNTAVKGLVTGSKSRRQGNNTDWINSVTYYDKYYQPIQSISTHQMQGTVKTSTLYAFSGEIQKTVNTYTHTGGPTKVERRFTYDHAGRPLKVYHKIDSNAEVMLSHFQYNELGEAMDIIHHSRNDGNTWLYKTGLKSTIQGWTDEILYSYQNGDPVFRQKLDYNKASGTSNATRHDGMITSNQWKHYGSGEPERVYNYTYDTPKRLTASTYREKTTSWVSNNLYTENDIVYSANGNITALKRNRDNSNSAVQMDVLSYSYNGNQLTGVADTAPAAHKAEGFNDGNSGTDYTYNGNGFIISDANKGISSIIYTISDKPQRINFSAGPNIRYTYSGGGNLITVSYHSTTNGPATKTIEYVGELVFEDDVLTEIRHEYGRVLANAGNRYQYYLTDHLGNTRVVLQEDPANFTLLATFEPDNIETESMQFMDYSEAPHIASSLFDHTETSDTGHALRLTNGETGPSRSVAVLPGDTVRMEVFGKYLDLSNKKTDPVLMALSLAMAAANPAASDIDGNLPTASSRISGTEQGLSGLLVGKERQNEAPPAYLNYLFFDKEMNYKYGGYTQMTEAAYEDGTDKTHERLYQEVVAEEAGYFYIYLSNDGTEGGEAFFDDFSIFTLESYIVQQTDYYPYGLVARNFVRAGEKETKELFQGKTYDELTGWYDFHARQYDAAVGRWFGVDPQNQFASPYLAMGNNPVMGIDPDGEFGFVIVGLAVFNAIRSGIQANNNGGNFWGAAGKSLAFSALNAAISGGIGGIFGDLGATQILGSKLLGEVGRAGTHALAGGALSSLGGGDFKSGAAASFFGSLAGSGLGASGAKGGLMIGGAALIGGTSSSIAGGDFWNGAVQSGIMATANHVRHKMIESGKIGGTLLIDKQVNPPGFDFTDYKELLQNRLIGEGFNPKTRVVDNSIGNSLSAWWRGSPTGKVTIKNYYSSRDTRTGQAFAELGDPNSAVLYNELGPARTGKVLPTWRYVNATIHEVGHTLFSFDDTNSGIMSKFDASRNPYSSFSQIQRDFILGSKWGR